MRVRLGDGREVECEKFERLPSPPMPDVLASERLTTEGQAWRASWLLHAADDGRRRGRAV